MLTKQNAIKCNECGRFIKLEDLANGKASHSLYTPDSDLTREFWESYCPLHYEQNRKVA